MNIYTLWLENDWVVKLMIIATFTVFIIVFEKIYQFISTFKTLKKMQNITSFNEIHMLPSSELTTILQDINSFEGEREALFNAHVGVKLDMFESYLMRYVSILGLIAILSPMLGLIGTFLGVWHVFEGVSQVSLSDPAIIAKGIKEVLIDTMAGLIVAVIAMIFYKSFEILGQKMVMSFEESLYKLLKKS